MKFGAFFYSKKEEFTLKKSIFKKGTSALLAMVMCLSTFFGIGSTTAFAAESTTDEVVMISFPRDGDDNLGGDWGHDELHYMNGWTASESSKITVYTVGSWTGNACYCIEPGTPLSTGDNLTKRDENYWDNYPSTYNSTISADEIKLFIGRIFQYGYTGTVSTSWRSQNADDADKMAHIMATQTLIWETVVGERDSNFNHVDTGSYDAINDRVSTSHPLYSRYISYYNSIASNVQKHSKVPSFCAKSTSKAQNVELEWNGTNYTATLTDTNNVLSQYTFTASESGINFSVSGNKLTITAEKAPTSAVSITATKNGSVRKGVVVWSDGVITPGSGIQDLTTFTAEVNDPVKGYLNIKVSVGSAKIVKTSEDGKIDGITFTITGNGIDKTVTTNAKGEVQIDNLTPGVYTVIEQNYDKYEPQEVRRVTVVSGQVATVSFNNVLKRGDLVVTKTSEDGLSEGVKFHLYGTSLSGLAVDEYAVTDSSGKAYFNDVLIGTNYTLEEVDGQNAISNNLILCNKANLLNQSAWLLGVPGSGKSFCAKGIMVPTILNSDDEILICDPEGEYAPMVEALMGDECAVIRVAAGGKDRLNAMYMVDGYGENDPIIVKSQFIMSLIEQIDSKGVGPQQKSIIDRCTRAVYREAEQSGIVPTLSTLNSLNLKQSRSHCLWSSSQPAPWISSDSIALWILISVSLSLIFSDPFRQP